MQRQVSQRHTQLRSDALIGVLGDMTHVFQHGGAQRRMRLHWELPEVKLEGNTGKEGQMVLNSHTSTREGGVRGSKVVKMEVRYC